MKTILSSGDIVADRRADYARALAGEGDHIAAADLMAQALERAPEWAAGWFLHGDYSERAGDRHTAAASFVRTLGLSPDDIYGAAMRLAALGVLETPDQPPSAYIERLFDDYASRFDKALVEGLGYTIPQQLAELVLAANDGGFQRVVDLGCGTGLMGERLRRHASFLVGYDLSSGMLAKAEAKGIYDRLGRADLGLAGAASGVALPQTAGEAADLTVAADVFMYFGDLSSVIATAGAITRPGGLFAFSVEDGGTALETTWHLRPSLRFAHGEAYVRGCLEASGFTVMTARRAPIRKDGAETIIGLLVIARRDDVAALAAGSDTPAVQRPIGDDLTAVLH